jgi:hypothetical protein
MSARRLSYDAISIGVMAIAGALLMLSAMMLLVQP